MDLEKLLDSMTIEEKCGQMTQITFEVIQNASNDSKNPVDERKLIEAVRDKGVGSVLNVPCYKAIKANVWQKVIKQIQDVAVKETRLKIPIIYGLDSIHGANYIQEGVLFPQPLNQAATFNEEIAYRIGEITALETRAIGVPWNFNPVLDIGRQPLWPRLYETYGEDVCLAVEMGRAYIEGHQGRNVNDLKSRSKAAACLKHYIGYSGTANGHDRSNSFIPELVLREFYLPTFAKGVAAGAQTVMINSGWVNYIPGHANSYYINDILKGELKFDGFVVSDWEDIIRLHTRDRVAETPEQAVRMAVMAGVDMSMVPLDFSFREICIDLAKKDPVFLKRVNEATMRILKVKERLGLFNNPYAIEKDLDYIGSEDSERFNLEAARESIILAKNEKHILPINPNKKVFVTGPTANLLRVLCGGWSYEFQGQDERAFQNFGRKKLTTLGAIEKKAKHVKYYEGANFDEVTNLEKAYNEAKNNDVIILCLGEDSYAETPGNTSNLTLSDSQLVLSERLFELKKPIVIVYIGGRPRCMNSIVEKSQAVLLAFLPGTRGSEAIADILFGQYNPNARLPVTYPLHPNAYVTYDHAPIEILLGNTYECLFPFGHGLSYSKFTYSRLTLSSKEFIGPDLTVEVDVTNNGSHDGKEVVLLYLNDEYASIPRPCRQLKKFKKVDLKMGQTMKVKFVIGWYDLSFIGVDYKRIVEPGSFNIYVADLSAQFHVKNVPFGLKI